MKSYIENELKMNRIPKNVRQPRNRTADIYIYNGKRALYQ